MGLINDFSLPEWSTTETNKQVLQKKIDIDQAIITPL
jgi:hypothetical protein